MVRRSQRLAPVVDVTAEAERAGARALGGAEARVAAAEAKLAELERYAQEYRETLRVRTATGIGAVELQAFHGFIARLGEAVAQQRLALRRAQEERDLLRERWLDARRRACAVAKVVDHATREERRGDERRDQRDVDERAQRACFVAGGRAAPASRTVPTESSKP